MLLEHSKIYLDAAGRHTDALLVRDGRIAAVGQAARDRKTSADEVVEPDGECLFPALADAHCHLWGLGLRAGAVDLAGVGSTAELYARLRAQNAADSPSGWALGYGWDEHGWPSGDGFRLGDLDRHFPTTPVCLHRVDRHAVVVNSEALRRAGLDTSYDPRGDGRAVRDASGALTGVLVDEAMTPILEAIPEVTVEEDRQVFLQTARTFRKHGIASAHMARTEVNRLDMLREMAGAGELPLRVYAIVDGADKALEQVLDVGPTHDPQGWLSIAAIKFFADGALGSQGAHLLDAYPDGTHGLVMHEPTELTRDVAALMEDGWQVAIHAIGDAAARHVIDAYAAVPERIRYQLRPRLEHAQMLTARDCERLGDLSAIASIQPIHLRSDAAWAPEVLTDAQLDRLYPWPLLVQNATLAAGSDYPIEDPNPWHGIATALTRQTARANAFMPDKALTREQILEAYTAGAAFAGHWENVLGRLDEGFAADIIALGRDPFEASPEEIWEMEVLQMWVGGS